jgi:hypothetical protein
VTSAVWQRSKAPSPPAPGQDGARGATNQTHVPKKINSQKYNNRLAWPISASLERHLLCLVRACPDEWRAAEGESHMSDLHRVRQASHLERIVAPVELVGLTLIEAQRNECAHRHSACGPRQPLANRCPLSWAPWYPRPRSSSNSRWVGCRSRLGTLASASRISLSVSAHAPQLRLRLARLLVAELGDLRPQHLAHCVARNPQLPCNPLDPPCGSGNAQAGSARSSPYLSLPARRGLGRKSKKSRSGG